MRVILVNPPKCEVERDEIAPPLGLLSLAIVAHEAGASVAVEDLNLLYHLIPDLRTDFYETAVRRLLGLGGDIYGFTSMAVDSHVALELARRIKASHPKARIVVGGPHFSAHANETVSHFPWVDWVAEGEGEGPFQAYLNREMGRGVPSRREPVHRSVVPDAYALVQLPAYFHVNRTRTFNFDAGRGCRYKCSFCYSPRFYGGTRDVDPQEVVREFSILHQLGADRLFLVGDNFLNNRGWAVRICEALEDARLGMKWYCYATLPDMTDDIAERMGRAGCSQVFMGIDVVGRTSEGLFRKAFVRRDNEFEHRLKVLRGAGVQPTCGFILTPPSHPGSVDLDATLEIALRARLTGADVLFNALSVYSLTDAHGPLLDHFEADPLQVDLLMDVPSVVQANPLVGINPRMFPFHSRYTGASEWRSFLHFCHAVHTILNSFPEALSVLWRERGVSPSEITKQVVARVGDVASLPVRLRRSAERDSALEVLREMMPGLRFDVELPPAESVEGERQGVDSAIGQFLW